MTEHCRNLRADLALAAQATPGPWQVEGTGGVHMDGTRDAYLVIDAAGRRVYPPCTCVDDARFAAAARDGWPEAIRRALLAEQRVAQLISTIAWAVDRLQEHDPSEWCEVVAALQAALDQGTEQGATRDG